MGCHGECGVMIDEFFRKCFLYPLDNKIKRLVKKSFANKIFFQKHYFP